MSQTVRNLLKVAGIVLPATFLHPVLAHAQEADEPLIQMPDGSIKTEEEAIKAAPDTKGIYTVAFENDIFAGEDNNYTNGVRFSYISPENDVPPWLDRSADALPFFSTEGKKRWQFAVGQSMFTPSDTDTFALQNDDRPYAGWLYANVGMVADRDDQLDSIQLTMGVVGPASGAEQTQDFIHGLVDSPKANGWDHQLKNELGLVLSYERKWRSLYEFTPFGWGLDITPSAGASVGNVYTHAAVGTMVRFGYDLPSDYGPPIIPPSLGGSDLFVPTSDFGWYIFAGLEGRAVARNIFLDGNTFRDSHSVDKEVFVGGLQLGIAFTIYETRLAYTHVFRTKEFEEQRDNDSYGALTASWRF